MNGWRPEATPLAAQADALRPGLRVVPQAPAQARPGERSVHPDGRGAQALEAYTRLAESSLDQFVALARHGEGLLIHRQPFGTRHVLQPRGEIHRGAIVVVGLGNFADHDANAQVQQQVFGAFTLLPRSIALVSAWQLGDRGCRLPR